MGDTSLSISPHWYMPIPRLSVGQNPYRRFFIHVRQIWGPGANRRHVPHWRIACEPACARELGLTGPQPVPSTFDFSSASIALTAGQDYFVTFSVATPINASIRYQALLLNTPDPNAFGFPAIDSSDGGSTWLSPVIPNEIGLTVTTDSTNTAVPEPSSLALLATGVIVARRRFVRRPRTTSRV
jgi:hypothetical protein